MATTKLSMELRPSYLPMSDDEEMEGNEPYSEEYHKKKAMLYINSVMQGDAIETIGLDEPMTNDSLAPGIKIVSVRSLNENTMLDNENTNSSISESQDSDTVRDMISKKAKSIFGIAKNKQIKKSPKSKKISKQPTSVLGRPKRKIEPKKPSKIGNFRKICDVAYRNRTAKIPKDSKVLSKEIDDSSETESNSKYNNDENSDADDEFLIDKTTNQANSIRKKATTPVPQPADVRKSNRRKTIHKPIVNDENDIEFVEDSSDQLPPSKAIKKLPLIAPPESSPPTISLDPPEEVPSSPRSQLLEERLKIYKNIPNPNSDLLKKVSFLRCCVNFMMKELGRQPYIFQRHVTMNTLKARYLRQKLTYAEMHNLYQKKP